MSDPLTEARAALAAPLCGHAWTEEHSEGHTFRCSRPAGHSARLEHDEDYDLETVHRDHLAAALAEVDRLRAALDAIIAKWGVKGLDRVKRMAWKAVETGVFPGTAAQVQPMTDAWLVSTPSDLWAKS